MKESRINTDGQKSLPESMENADGLLVHRCRMLDEKTGERCRRYGEPGYAVCEKHSFGDKTKAMSEITKGGESGDYSKAFVGVSSVKELYERFRKEDSLVDLREELAVQKAMLFHQLQTVTAMDYEGLLRNQSFIQGTIAGIRKTIEAITKMQERMTVFVHVSHIEVMMGAVINIIREETGDNYEMMGRIASRLERLHLPDGNAGPGVTVEMPGAPSYVKKGKVDKRKLVKNLTDNSEELKYTLDYVKKLERATREKKKPIDIEVIASDKNE